MQLYFYNGQPTTYSITNDGKLFNNKTKKWLKGQISKNGYLTYNISMISGKKRLYAHRMILETYSPIDESEKFEVNHKDLNKLNNNLENLEWVTSSENKTHSYLNNLDHQSCKKIYCFDDKHNLVGEYPSLAEASRVHSCSVSILSNAVRTNPKIKAKGYYWSDTDDSNFVTTTIGTGVNKKVGKIDISTGEVLDVYHSINEAARINNIGRTHIGECCNGKIKTYKGFIWIFI